jgi:hypothetical protein
MTDQERNELLQGLDIVGAALRGAHALALDGEERPTSSRLTELAAVLALAGRALADVIRRVENENPPTSPTASASRSRMRDR